MKAVKKNFHFSNESLNVGQYIFCQCKTKADVIKKVRILLRMKKLCRIAVCPRCGGRNNIVNRMGKLDKAVDVTCTHRVTHRELI